MNKKYLISLIIVVAAAMLIFLKPVSDTQETQNNEVSVHNYKNSTYTIEGQSVVLTDGFSEVEAAPGSVTKTTTRYFGNELRHDLDDDGDEDVVFILTEVRGGSGQFFYVVAALNTPTGYTGSAGYFLGDRIAPQSTNIDEGVTTQGTIRSNVIVVNVATRIPNEPMTAIPSVGKSVWIKLDPNTMQFGEVAQDFEGESR